jgi:hypothetical protein
MICEEQEKCKNCEDDIKCFFNCYRYVYVQNLDEIAINNFELKNEEE